VAGRIGALLRRWAHSQAGVTAVEFGIISVVFIPLLVGVMSISLYFFTSYSMTNAMLEASRGVRTGQFQQGTGAYSGAQTTQDRENVFRNALCAKLPPYLSPAGLCGGRTNHHAIASRCQLQCRERELRRPHDRVLPVDLVLSQCHQTASRISDATSV
jgi:hypothetical protein